MKNAINFGNLQEHIIVQLARNAFQEWIIIVLGLFVALAQEIINRFYFLTFICWFIKFNFYLFQIGASIYSYFSLVYCINEYQ